MSVYQQNIEAKLYQLATDFLRELGAERALQNLSINASLDKDLGIDSLGKVELIHRINTQFKIQLSETVLTEAQILKDLIDAIEKANPAVHYQANQFADRLEHIQFNADNEENIVDIFLKYNQLYHDRPHIYLRDETGAERLVTYGDLYQSAKAVAIGLREHGLQRGETVALMVPTSKDYFSAYIGTLLAGGIPISIYPPYRPQLIEEYIQREAKVLNNAEARVLITFSQAERLSKLFKNFIPSLKLITTVPEIKINEGKLPRFKIQPEDTVLIQYTSGSTGNPKGVQLHHSNLLANVRAVKERLQLNQADVGVSWVPLYHDMGLIFWLGSLTFGVPITIMSPWAFLSRPENWLWAIHYHRGTYTAGPNFAFELCIKKINTDSITGLDLRSLRIAINGAEAIQPRTLERFTKKFAPYGFHETAFCPAYGLAESTVALSLPSTPRKPVVDKVKHDVFETNYQALPITSSDKHYLEFVGVGQVIRGQEIRIVDKINQSLPDRSIGHIQFRGGSSMQGYYRNEEATQSAYHDGWWDTGDYGYLVDNELFITGRKKDLIIKAGRNITPEEIEYITSQNNMIRKGCVVAFGIQDKGTGTEELIIVAETKVEDKKSYQIIMDDIRQKVTSAKDITPDKILLVPPQTIPKTSSGKLQRSATKDLYLKGKIYKKYLPFNVQLIKIVGSSFAETIKKAFRFVGKCFYTGYIALITALITLPLLPLFYVFPNKLLTRVAKLWAKLICIFSFCPIHKRKISDIPEDRPLLIVPNHCSYIDAIVLLATLPHDIAFVGKKELLSTPLLRTIFYKLRYLTVDRVEFSESVADANLIEQALKEKRAIVIFPEGTFTYATGLRSFKLGAFKLAVDTQTTILPLALKGTRTVLRSESHLFQWGTIDVTVLPPMTPQENDWKEVLRLKNETRKVISQHCGEPLLDVVVAGPEE